MQLTIRVWQTLMFLLVTLVGMFVLTVSVFSGIRSSTVEINESEQLRDATALAKAIGPEFPITVESLARLRSEADQFRDIFGDDYWIFTSGGRLIESQATLDPGEEILDEAFLHGLADAEQYAYVEFGDPGMALASKVIVDESGRRVGAVVVAEPTSDTETVMDAATDRLSSAFLIALLAAGLIGFVISSFMAGRIKLLSDAAYSIADGDFDKRLPKSLLPDEVMELADAYNKMAEELGTAFGAIQAKEQEMEAVVESMAEGLIAVDALRVVTIVNGASTDLLRMRVEDLFGNSIDDVIADDSILKMVDQGLSGDSRSGTTTFGRSTLELHVAPISSEGEIVGAVLLLRDITERILWEKAQREFIGNASHEMKTPVAAMKGFLELLESGAKNDIETRDDFLGTMYVEAERLSRLVSDLFLLAQLDSRRVRIEPYDERVSELVDDVVAIMRPIASAAEVTLRTDLAPEDPHAICDRDRIKQVLLGLVDNATKYAGKGQKITVRTRIKGTRVEIAVVDTGPGISEDELPHVFERFYRTKGARRGGEDHGAGLGLSIAKEILDAHDSLLGVSSRLGEGTEFHFSLDLV